MTGLAGSASWGARGRGKESRGWGSPRASYISVILHGLLQNCAGQLGLCPVLQPGIQGLQVGLHAGAPWEVLQRGERGEKTQISSWKQQGSPQAPLAHQHRHRAAPASSLLESSMVLARFWYLSLRGWELQLVCPHRVASPLCACSGSKPQPQLREAKSHTLSLSLAKPISSCTLKPLLGEKQLGSPCHQQSDRQRDRPLRRRGHQHTGKVMKKQKGRGIC